MTTDDRRSHSLRRLRDGIENNLSRLLGSTIAHEIINTILPLDSTSSCKTQDVHCQKSRMAVYCSRLAELADELDNFRRNHQNTLQTLPMAACAIHSATHEVMLWNQAMTELTGIVDRDVLGQSVKTITEPWSTILGGFLQRPEQHLNRHAVDVAGTPCYFSLHKAAAAIDGTNQVILLEDQTETRMLEEQLFHSERLASIGQLAAGVAHEIDNPITGINFLAQELSSYTSDPIVRNNARQIREQTDRVSRIVQTLVSYARTSNNNVLQQHDLPSTEPVEISSIVKEAITLLQLSHKNDNILFRNQCSEALYVSGDGQKLQQVFTNLLKNAADASESDDPNGTSVVCVNTSASKHTVTIHVEDQGHGIPEPLQEKLFEPFFTTKEDGHSIGLGLALTWSIIEEHIGTIEVVSPLDLNTQRGTRFIISLPRCEAPLAVPNATAPQPIATEEEIAQCH